MTPTPTMWEPKLTKRSIAQDYSCVFICPRCKAPAEIWFESFKGGGTYIKVRHVGERVFPDGTEIQPHRCYVPTPAVGMEGSGDTVGTPSNVGREA